MITIFEVVSAVQRQDLDIKSPVTVQAPLRVILLLKLITKISVVSIATELERMKVKDLC